MYYVYILKSTKDNKHYIGSTHDLKRRLSEHQLGKVESTKARRPFLLEYYEAYCSKELAVRQELLYKTGQGRRILKKRLQLELL